ncbi:hypothetical protein V6N13_009964 [Hibiscus sabdariffa]
MPLCHLQYPVAYLSRLQKILPPARWKLRFRAARTTCPTRVLRPRHVPLGAKGPYCGSAIGRRAHASLLAQIPSQRRSVIIQRTGKTILSHDGLNPAHVPYWWVNNPTLGEFCFTMIGRADIEGSKSNVAMKAWLPQASYPCGHLRYLLTDVPPQPNSPPDNVFRPDRPAEADLVSKKRGCAPLPIHGISKITLKVVVFQFRPRAPTYPRPLKSFHKVGLELAKGSSYPEGNFGGNQLLDGIVHHLLGPDRHALTRTLLRRSRLLGPCFKTVRMGSPQADAQSTLLPKHVETARAGFHDRGDDVSTGVSKARAWAATTIRVGPRPEPIDGPALAVPHPTGAHRRPPYVSLPTISSTL